MFVLLAYLFVLLVRQIAPDRLFGGARLLLGDEKSSAVAKPYTTLVVYRGLKRPGHGRMKTASYKMLA